MITRYFNPKMLEVKEPHTKIIKKLNQLSLILFIANWIIFSFVFAFFFLVVLFLNNVIYIIIIKQLEKQKEQEAFKQQFGESSDGKYTKEDIIKTHINNLFESDVELDTLTKSDIKKQYRAMAKKYHPDVNDSADQQDKFHSINQSYKYLLDLIKH